MAINRIDHAAIRVRNMSEALDWYEGVLGLTVLDRNGERTLLACSGTDADLTLIEGGQSLVSFAFGVDNEGDLDEVEARLRSNGVAHERYREPDRPGHGEILGFDLPSGHRMELAVGYGDRVAGQTNTVSDGTFRPTDIDHINLLGELRSAGGLGLPEDGPRVQAVSRAHLRRQLGGVVDACVHERPRHRVHAGPASEGDRLHHVAFAVEDGNHYFRLGDRFIETGNRFEFGPGRHMGGIPRDTQGFGTNCFAYAFDPTGNRNEFSAGMGDFADDEVYFHETSPDKFPDIMNGWAYNMPESFMTIGS